MSNIDASVFYMIDQMIFVINSATVFTLQITSEGFGFSNSVHTAVSFNIFYKLINTFECFFILSLSIEVILPGVL